MSEAVNEVILQPQAKFVLPSGKELNPTDVLRFCYDLNETDVQILETLLKLGSKTVNELGEILRMSKGTINRSVNKLVKIGLIARIKETRNNVGRPRYVYNVPKFDEFKGRIAKEIEECANTIRDFMIKNLENKDTFLAQVQAEELNGESSQP